jgi:arylsulfatase A-like enzyme
VYAAMVDHMDANIGRVVAHLKATGEYDNTMVLFMSDNGAEGGSIEAAPILGEEVTAHIAQYYDNSLDNIGRKNSFVWYGSLWAQAATAPSRLFKGYSTEGGCRVPLVVKPPRGLSLPGSAGGGITKAYCTVMDVVPTFLDLAGLTHPRIYKDRQVAPLRGASWKPFLEAASEGLRVGELRIHDQNYATGFECSGSGALIKGDWKVVFVPAPRGPHRWELFNVKADPGETVDLREREPEVFSEMMAHWEEYKKDVGVVGVANELEPVVWGAQAGDEFQDPYGWIKFMGRPDTVPEHLKGVVPV